MLPQASTQTGRDAYRRTVEQMAALLRALGAAGYELVVVDYGVTAAPYFVYVEGGRVQGEGSASGWKQIASLLRDAIDDRARATRDEGSGGVDRVLSAAGIGPGHPSLYPDR